MGTALRPSATAIRVSPVTQHGFDALMRPPSGQVCHSLIVVSNCTPGSAQRHAAWAISSHSFLAGMEPTVLPSVRAVKFQFVFSFNDLKNEFGMRTELLEFCPDTV